MPTQQPKWKLIGTVGDRNPIDYDGGYVYVDETGVYDPEVEYIQSDAANSTDEPTRWTVYRFSIDQLKLVNRKTPYQSEYMKIHNIPPQTWPCLVPRNWDETWLEHHPPGTTSDMWDKWFNHGDSGEAEALATSLGMTIEEWHANFCSDDPRVRAWVYASIGYTHGFENLDSYSLTFTDREELEKRYEDERK